MQGGTSVPFQNQGPQGPGMLQAGAEWRLSPWSTIALSLVTVVLIGGSLFWLQWASQQGITLGYPKPLVRIKPLASASPTRNQAVQFSAQGVGRDLTYSWDFGDIPLPDGQTAQKTGENVSYAFTYNGEHTVTLSVRDAIGQTARTTLKVDVMPLKPTASFTYDTGWYSLDLYFDASQSSADEGVNVDQYNWDFGDGETDSSRWSSYLSHNYDHAGTYTVTLTVIDEYGLASDPYTMQVQVKDD
jgi:hypothetical protein